MPNSAAPGVSNISVTADYSSAVGSKVVLTGTARLATNFLSVLNIDHIDISASTTSTWGNTRLRVALVLDNTGSMASSNKMTALKTASQNLLATLKAAATTPDDVYVSIIPFNKDVNVDPSNVGASWLRWDLWEAANGSLQQHELSLAKQLPVAQQDSGRRTTTAPGTAASPTATRISIPPMTRRSPAARCIRPSSIPPARYR